MKKECEEIQIKIVTFGIKAASADPAVKAHLVGCPLCGDFVHSAAELERTEDGLPEYDVPEDVFARTISEVKKAQAAIRAQAAPVPAEKRKRWLRYLFDPIVAPALVAAMCGVLVLTLTFRNDVGIRSTKVNEAPQKSLSAPASVQQEVKQHLQDAVQVAPETVSKFESVKPAGENQAISGEAKELDGAATTSGDLKKSAPILGERSDLGRSLEGSIRQESAPAKVAPRLRAAEPGRDSVVPMEQAADMELSAEAPAVVAGGAEVRRGLKAKADANVALVSLDAAAGAVDEGRFEDARSIIDRIYPVRQDKARLKASAGRSFIVDVTSADREKIFAALDDIQREGRDTPEARKKLRELILQSSPAPSQVLRPAME